MTPTACAGPWFARLPVKLSYLAIPNREPEHAKAARSLGRQMDRICSVVDLHPRPPISLSVTTELGTDAPGNRTPLRPGDRDCTGPLHHDVTEPGPRWMIPGRRPSRARIARGRMHPGRHPGHPGNPSLRPGGIRASRPGFSLIPAP
jgi:hypothetical protein